MHANEEIHHVWMSTQTAMQTQQPHPATSNCICWLLDLHSRHTAAAPRTKSAQMLLLLLPLHMLPPATVLQIASA
jgi:hypothetical protein